MAKKVQLVKVVNSNVQIYYPKTSADNVAMDSGDSVEDTIAELQTAIATLQSQLTALTNNFNALKAELDLDTVYMKDSNDTILTDGSGNNLVAVY